MCKLSEAKRWGWGAHQFIWSAPMLPVMRRGWHMPLIFGLSLISLICFILQKGGQVYKVYQVGPLHGWEDHRLYWVYVATIVVTLFFALVAHKLSGMEAQCDRFLKDLHKLKKHEEKKLREKMDAELRSFVIKPPTTSAPKP